MSYLKKPVAPSVESGDDWRMDVATIQALKTGRKKRKKSRVIRGKSWICIKHSISNHPHFHGCLLANGAWWLSASELRPRLFLQSSVCISGEGAYRAESSLRWKVTSSLSAFQTCLPGAHRLRQRGGRRCSQKGSQIYRAILCKLPFQKEPHLLQNCMGRREGKRCQTDLDFKLLPLEPFSLILPQQASLAPFSAKAF